VLTAGLVLLLVGAPDADALAAEYFKAGAERRAAIVAEPGAADTLAPADVPKWREKLLKLAEANGRKLKKSGRSTGTTRRRRRGSTSWGAAGARAAS
jgi:hypothetical protein